MKTNKELLSMTSIELLFYQKELISELEKIRIALTEIGFKKVEEILFKK